MGDPSRSTTPTLLSKHYSTLGLPKTASLADISKAYKSLVMKCHPDRNSSNRAEAEAKFRSINEAYKVLITIKKEEGNASYNDFPKTPKHTYCNEDGFCISSPTLVSSTSIRASPTSTPRDFSRSSSRSKTPTPTSTRDFFVSPSIRSSAPTTPTAPTTPKGTATVSKMTSRISRPTTPTSTRIIFSHSASTTRRKPPPVEKKLKCTLEELCNGCVKKIKITRNVISHFGAIVQEEEILTIKVKPGWKKGTKITFEGKGDEKPGTLPADIIFIIDEKRHHLYKRVGDDLDLGVEVPLVQALTGCIITVPLLGGDNMTLTFHDILYPGYEKIIPGQGMPKPKRDGRRGDLQLKFLVQFPAKLSDEQRADIVRILEEEEDDS